MLFGLDVGVISGAEDFIQQDFKISDDAIEFIVSSLLWGAAFGALFSGVLSSRFGRRRTILISAVNFIIGALLCALAPNEHVLIAARFVLGIAVGVASFTAPLYRMISNAKGVMEAQTVLRSADYAYPAVFALLVFIIGFAMSAGPIIWVLCSEIYPLAGRDLGVTCSTGTNWIVNAIVGMTFLTLINTFGPGKTFLLYGGLNVLFILFFILFVPETKGVSLERIERNLMSGLPLRKIGR